MDQNRFESILAKMNQPRSASSIGTLQEKLLHQIVKKYIEDDENCHEQKIGFYYADIVNNQGICEIQTQHFYKLKNKLAYFLEHYQVRVVFPTFYRKYLIWYDQNTQETTAKRKSWKLGSVYRIFSELYQIKMFLRHPGLKFTVLLIDLEEIRVLDGWSADRKKGSHRLLQIPCKLQEEITIDKISDYKKLIPDTLEEEFTSVSFAKAAKLSINKARTALNVLFEVGAVERIKKAGKFFVYRKKEQEL